MVAIIAIASVLAAAAIRGSSPGAVHACAREVQPREGEGAIVFFPDGASTGGRVQLALDDAAWQVEVAWLTGQVRAAAVGEPP